MSQCELPGISRNPTLCQTLAMTVLKEEDSRQKKAQGKNAAGLSMNTNELLRTLRCRSAQPRDPR